MRFPTGDQILYDRLAGPQRSDSAGNSPLYVRWAWDVRRAVLL